MACVSLALAIYLRYAGIVPTQSLADDLLTADAPRAAEALDNLAGDLVRQLDRSIRKALAGDRRAVVVYVGTWRQLEERVVDAVRATHPDILLDVEGTRLFVEVKGRQRPLTWAHVLPLHAPFSPWAEKFGRGRGAALALLAELRSHLPLGVLLTPPVPSDDVTTEEMAAEEVHRFLRLVVDELTREEPPLARVAELFELSRTELGRLFGVRRQAASQWLESGVPPARAAKVNAVARLADILERNLKRERIPGVVRQPAEAYGGLSMLEMIERDRHDELVRQVEDAFDWAQAA